MNQKTLAPYNDRPFFERVLHYGIKHNIISHEILNNILESGPIGIVQIAKVFGSKYVSSEILSAQNRIVNLVSLYLEDASEGDITKAIEILSQQPFLSLSKGGSDMIKDIHSLPDLPILGEKFIPIPLSESYDTFAPTTTTPSQLLEKYKNIQLIRIKNQNSIQACEWLISKFPQLHKDELSGYSAEGVIATLLLFSLNGLKGKTLPTKQQILERLNLYYNKKINWNNSIQDIPMTYLPLVQEIITNIDRVLKIHNPDIEDIGMFESGSICIRDIDEYEKEKEKE